MTLSKWEEFIELTKVEGINPLFMVENAGRSLAQIALWTSKPNPRIVILVGTGAKGPLTFFFFLVLVLRFLFSSSHFLLLMLFVGSIGLCAGRHLANHGCQVILCKSKTAISEDVLYQRKLYLGTTGKECHIGSLPVETVDLIIDALVGSGLKGAPKGKQQAHFCLFFFSSRLKRGNKTSKSFSIF
jgi:NAD(P)H-hydrate repair Nnr-like enzyme with NAD(P)H-hydrate epimerase domain